MPVLAKRKRHFRNIFKKGSGLARKLKLEALQTKMRKKRDNVKVVKTGSGTYLSSKLYGGGGGFGRAERNARGHENKGLGGVRCLVI